MSKKKILVVDDERDQLDLLSLRLRNAGYEVICAEDGCEAFRRTRADNPDLIILDIMLPKMNGYEICGLIKADMKLKKIPIVLLTAIACRDDMELGKAAGANAYITKPVEGNLLIETIEKLLATASPGGAV